MREISTMAKRAEHFLVCLVLAVLTTSAFADHDRTHQWIPMRDGKRLSADVYLPQDQPGPWPIILIQTPYNKQLYRDAGLPLDTDDYGFVIVDWRGYWGSILATNPSAVPGEDGYDCVEWIATQPWSDGNVGTWGPSALGVRQFQTAREQPPHLRACVPMVSSFQESYGKYFPGGVLREEYVSFLDVYYGFAELILAHPTYDTYWWTAELLTDETRSMNVPMLLQTGWYDLDAPAVIRAYEKLRERSARNVRDDHRLLIGPWTHSGTDELTQGELEYPEAVGIAERTALDFFDYWLREEGEGVSNPPIGYFDLGTRTWRRADDWPSSRVVRGSVYLHDNGILQLDPPTSPSAHSEFEYDPTDPSPTWGGNNLLESLVPTGPYDQTNEVESRHDVLIFTTPVIAEPATIEGAMEAVLFASSDQVDTDFMVRVTDVYPDGRSMLIADGARRGRLRDGYGVERLMIPGEVYEIVVPIPDVAITLEPGHRLRIDITSSNYPRFHANPNDGGPMYDPAATPMTATNRIYHDAERPSRLVIPVIR